MTTTNQFAAFERDERIFRIIKTVTIYAAIVLVSALFGAALMSPSLLKTQCEQQALRSGSTTASCSWSDFGSTKETPGRVGYLF